MDAKDLIHEEKQILERNLSQMKQQYDKLTKQLHQYNEQYNDVKHYLANHYNEIDSMEIFSNQQSLTRVDQVSSLIYNQQKKLEKIMSSPYFSRIDFVYEGDLKTDAEAIYIGRFSFTNEEGIIVVHDWRAPISNMYYEFELGPAHYNAIEHTIHGEIINRRQLKIVNQQLEYVVEHNMTIHDQILQQELSQNADHNMKTIIATIQKEQNEIIRNHSAHTIILQGVAGSGKSSIALHRIAYLLYKLRETLTPDRVMIISPNKVFSSYIATVLPELGEEPVLENSIEDIAKQYIPAKLRFMSQYEHIRATIEQPSGELAKRSATKSSLAFYHQLQQYFAQYDAQLFAGEDLKILDVIIDANYIVERFMSYSKLPILKRIDEITEDIYNLLRAKPHLEVKKSIKKEIAKRLKSRITQLDALKLYQSYFDARNESSLLHIEHGKLEFPDLFPYLLCVDHIEGLDNYHHIRHLVIDEMQDYTPVQFSVIQKLFPCSKTIVGDLHQSLNPYAIHEVDMFRTIFTEHEYFSLTKSYRSSYEIIEFAKQFLPHTAIEAIERHGSSPRKRYYDDDKHMLDLLAQELDWFLQSRHETCCILCKHEQQVDELYERLQANYKLTKLNAQSDAFVSGITISTITIAKGLEFDHVILPYVDEHTYYASFDNNLLYISCTRALHELALLIDSKAPSLLVHL